MASRAIYLLFVFCCWQYGNAQSYGKDFYLGFMKNLDGNSNKLYLMITTTSESSVSVTIETSHHNQQVSVRSASPARVLLTHASEGPITSSDYANRNKGIHVYTKGEADISVLVMNIVFGSSTGEYLAYPYLDLEQEKYVYYTINTNSTSSNSTLKNEVLIVASENNTQVTITPTQPVALPRDAQSNSQSIPVSAGVRHTVTLHQRQTLLFNSVEDLTGTKIESDKPLTVISGHECGNIPFNVRNCEHLAVQVPPTITWGKNFLLIPFATGQHGSQVYKAVLSENTATNRLLLTCNNHTSSVEFPYEFEIATDSFCFLTSSKAVFLTQWSRDGSTVSPVVPISQYFNRVSFDSLPLYPFFFFYNYISIAVPAENYISGNVFLDGRVIRCTWRKIYDVHNEIVGYGCTVRTRSGGHVISSSQDAGKLSVIVHGTHLFNSLAYAYFAGMTLKPTNLPVNETVLFTPSSFPFYDLMGIPGVKELPRTVDAISEPIYFNRPIPLQFRLAGKAFVSENGVISFEKEWNFTQPELLPTSNKDLHEIDVIAPFWSDNDIRKNGTVRYVAIEKSNSTEGDQQLDAISTVLQQRGYTDFSSEFAIIAQWDHVHPFPHGSPSGYNIPEEELKKTNTYQVVVVTNRIRTFIQFTYSCDGMQWSSSLNKFAVVGYSLHGVRAQNLPASGFPYVQHAVSCPTQHRNKRDNHCDACQNCPCELPCDEDSADCQCNQYVYLNIRRFENLGINIREIANQVLPSCPSCLSQAENDYRFIKMDNISYANCFMWAFFESRGEFSFTKQCCYDELRSIIRDFNKRGASSIIGYHPKKDWGKYMEEENFRSFCCNSSHGCQNYFIDLRPVDDDSKTYNSPIGAHIWGDPHYHFFNQRYAQFHGNEKYVVLKIMNNASKEVFSIHAKHIQMPGRRATNLQTIAFGLRQEPIVYQFGDGNVFRTLGQEELLISQDTPIGYTHWDSSLKAFLQKKSNRHLLAVFKLGSNAVSLYACLRKGRGVTFMNLKIFIPQTDEFQENKTVGLIAIWDGKCIKRNLDTHDCEHDGFATWKVNETLDGNLFHSGNRKRRQAVDENLPYSYESFNYTTEQIAVCGDDQACLFDYAVTGQKDFAETTLESGKNFTKTVDTLMNYPPLLAGDSTFQVIVGQEAVYNFTVKDNSSNFTVTAMVDAGNVSLTNDGNGNYSFRLTIFEPHSLNLSLVAEDSMGAAASLNPIVEVCGCKNGGKCTVQGLLQIEITTIIMNCECSKAYSGQFCQNDRDGCSEIQCFDGVDCIDVQEPGFGATCGPCPTGYTGDGNRCLDIDECATKQRICDQLCNNTDGSYICTCKKGYELSDDGIHCQDIDECSGALNDCQQQCNNTEGSYHCACQEGFMLNSDGKNCIAQNLCLHGSLQCSHTCALVNGIAKCFCPVGFEVQPPENTQCIDKNECTQFNPCDQICTNTVGSFICSCRHGYRYDEDGNKCEDINECKEAARDGIVLCAENSICRNTPGSYNCACFRGYARINGTCQFDQPCKNGGGCSHICSPVNGSAQCSCPTGYRLINKTKCTDIDECSGVNDCQQQCINTEGSYNCYCRDGFALNSDGKNCTDIDECSGVNDCQQQCNNTEGSYQCYCQDGFTSNNDGKNCIDIDECQEAVQGSFTICPQNSTCRNIPGSYNCTCFVGFTMVDGICLSSKLAENGFKVTVTNYNKENFTEPQKGLFKSALLFIIYFGHSAYIRSHNNNMPITPVPYPGSRFASGEIAEATIRDNMQGRVTFLMYFKWPGGLLPGNALRTILQEGRYRTQFATSGFTLV